MWFEKWSKRLEAGTGGSCALVLKNSMVAGGCSGVPAGISFYQVTACSGSPTYMFLHSGSQLFV